MDGPLPRRALLLPLGGFLLLSLAGCMDRELLTEPAPDRPAYVFSLSGPVVTDLGDAGDGTCGATCTLRDAVATAKDWETIAFADGLTGTVVLTQGYLYIDTNLAINGPGAHLLTVDASQTEAGMYASVFRILYATVLLSNLTITGGHAANEGGGIYVRYGELQLNRSVVTANSTGEMGGGIFSDNSTVAIWGSTISDNFAKNGGAGISTGVGSTLTVEQSTISGNISDYDGGGIESDWAPITLIESTVSGNRASYGGGGIICHGTGNTILNSTISGNLSLGYGGGGGIRASNCEIQVSHSTITGNRATQGGGGVAASDHEGTVVAVRNSIIWGNEDADSPDDVASDDQASHFTSLGYNLLGIVGPGNAFDATGDLAGIADAGLGALEVATPALTATHALLESSPAINAGTCTDPDGATVAGDQRGVTRPQGGLCDIGAYELEGVAPPPPPLVPDITCTFQRNPKNGQLAALVTWANADPGVTLIQVVDGRTVTKQQAPSASGTWSTSLKTASDVLTYGVWGGTSRKDTSSELVPAGTACTRLE